jgi:hypothetical protein
VPLDEVKPGNRITQELRKLIVPQPAAKGAGQEDKGSGKIKLSWAR